MSTFFIDIPCRNKNNLYSRRSLTLVKIGFRRIVAMVTLMILLVTINPQEKQFGMEIPPEEEGENDPSEDLNETSFSLSVDLDTQQPENEGSPHELEFVYLKVLRFEAESSEWPFRGEATVYFEGGHTYKGMVSDGLLHGQGVFTMENGLKYEGEFVCNKPKGHGTYTWPDGSTYTGGVHNGRRHGFGTYKCSKNNLSYKGEWQKSLFHGKGTVYYNEKRTSWYKGDWVKNQREGWGERCYPSGSTYVGQWKNNIRHGEGTMTWENLGQQYIGKWKDGLQHGQGIHYWYVQRTEESQYFHSNRYKGEFFQGQRHGVGSLYYAGGAVFRGEWAHNKKNGRGEFTLRDGRAFIGELVDDRVVSPNMPGFISPTPLGMFPPATSIVLGPYMVLRIDSLLRKIPEKRRAIEHKQAEFMVLQFEKDLRSIYSFYSRLGHNTSPDNTYQMSRLQFRCLLKDCNIHRHGLTLKEIEYLIYEKDTCPIKLPTPFTPMLLHDYLSSLVILSCNIYKDEMANENYLLAACIWKLMKDDVLPNATHVKGFLFKHPNIATVSMQYLRKCWEVYIGFCNVERICRVRTMTCRQVLWMFKNLHLLDENLNPSKSIEIITNESGVPNIPSPLDLEITFLEFFEILIQCANVKCQSINSVEKEEPPDDLYMKEGLLFDFEDKTDTLSSLSQMEIVSSTDLECPTDWNDNQSKPPVLGIDELWPEIMDPQPVEPEFNKKESPPCDVVVTIQNIHYFFNRIFFPAFGLYQMVTKDIVKTKRVKGKKI